MSWEWPPDRPFQPPEPVVATTRSPPPTFETNGIRVAIGGVVLLDSRLEGEPGERCREIIDRGLRNQGEHAAQRDTTCLVVSYWMSASPTVPASIEGPIRLQRFRTFDSILVMPPGTATYDPTWGAEIQTPGGSAFHFQEYIDVRPGARIGFDIGSDAIGFTSFEYEIPSLDAFEAIDLPW